MEIQNVIKQTNESTEWGVGTHNVTKRRNEQKQRVGTHNETKRTNERKHRVGTHNVTKRANEQKHRVGTHNVTKRTNAQSGDAQCNQTNERKHTFLDPSFHYYIDN